MKKTTKTTATIEEINANIQAIEEVEASEEAAKSEFTEAEIAATKTRYISKNFWDCLD